MKLLVGLGNPGVRYARNRHNVGFRCVDAIAQACSSGPWRRKFQGEFAEAQMDNQRVGLLKPQTYMNKSGDCVGEAARFFKIEPEDIWVFHDEIDLAPGKLRVKRGGGHAGHNGLRSIHAVIGDGYGRLRIGVGHPGDKDAVAQYVLADFPKSEQVWLEDVIAGCGRGAPWLVRGDTVRFMNEVSRHPKAQTRSSHGKDEPAPYPATSGANASLPVDDGKSAIEKLIDKFR